MLAIIKETAEISQLTLGTVCISAEGSPGQAMAPKATTLVVAASFAQEKG